MYIVAGSLLSIIGLVLLFDGFVLMRTGKNIPLHVLLMPSKVKEIQNELSSR
jgi:uncharacterized membrane protein